MPFDPESAKRAARKRWDTPKAEPVAKAKADYSQLSNYGLYRSGSYFNWDYEQALRGRRASETYREMATDSTVGAMLFAIDKILRRVEWTVEPTGSADDGTVGDADIERADFLQTCLDDLSHSWEGFIADALTMLPYGFALVEIVYKTRETIDLAAPATKRTRHPDGKVGWRKFVLVPQYTVYDWQYDEYGGIQAAEQQTGWGGRIVLPIEKALLFRTDYRTPQGTSVLRTSFQPWYRKKHIESAEGIGVERDLAGLPVIYSDADYYQRYQTELKNIVRNIRIDEQMGVVLPVSYDDNGNPSVKLELLSSGGQKAFDTNAIVNRYKRDIASTLLMDLILLGQDKIGTQALASEKRDLSDTVLQAWLNEIACVLNDHAVPRLFQLNGEPLDHLPRICPGELRPTDVNEFFVAMKDAAAAGFMFAGDPEVEAEARRRAGLPAMPPELQERLQDEMVNPPEPPPMIPQPDDVIPGEEQDDEDDA